ncbi:MAG TPA: preprotein translocase subunit SecG [Desulfotomaculum sp.]|nr:preprotein translocase subunit SecG [Desulfotomaculum sp.]
MVTVVHVLVSLALIAVVLLQSGRSAGLSGTIAGGAEALFGKKKGLDELLGKFTTAVAVLFGITSLLLGFWQ